MSSSTDESRERNRISKVSISSISPETLVVRIRKFSTEVKPEDLPQISSDYKSIIARQADTQSDEQSRLAMADSLKKSFSSSKPVKKQKQRTRTLTEKPDSLPCIKHAAENISRKASLMTDDKINLCNNCSKSMLSYIFLVQDFLDSLAKEISGDATPNCLQCARQEVRNSVSGDILRREEADTSKDSQHRRIDDKSTGDFSSRTSNKRTSKTRSRHQDSKGNDEPPKNVSSQGYAGPSGERVEFVYHVSPPTDAAEGNIDNLSDSSDGEIYENPPISGQSASNPPDTHGQYFAHPDNSNPQQTASCSQSTSQQQTAAYSHSSSQEQTGTYDQKQNSQPTASDNYASNEQRNEGTTHPDPLRSSVNSSNQIVTSHQNEEFSARTVFRAPMERVQPNYDAVPSSHPDSHNDNNCCPVELSPTLYRDDVDGIISTLSNAEREIYDNARNGAGWESLTETQERLGSSSNIIATEAFVTSCRNNAEAIGCLVVGTSLLLCKTSRTLCVLVSDGVSKAFRGALSTVFQVVQNVRSLDSLGSTKLALLEQPELGITFEKLNVWRLTQFSKCVYLNPDTLVVQNCDELFCHEELSAVPDIGWPDCFNSGVFVFTPSVHTFWMLMEHADKQGSYDGGDQGLLNSYFNAWSSDISSKLSFIYNLMANVSYTYTPAFKQFGRSVKIVQFHGSFKPWHVKFFTASGQVSPSSPVHPTYVQFVHIWLNIFRISVLRLMSQEIQSYAASQETICAVEILRFFPLPSESEADFFLTPPSVRVRLAEKKLDRPSSFPASESRRRKSAEFSRYDISEEESISEKTSVSPEAISKDTKIEMSQPVASESEEGPEDKPEDNISEADDVFKDEEVSKREKAKNSLPGAEVGDYQGMTAWEQGRIDYEGSDSSDNVLKRLQFLMSRPK